MLLYPHVESGSAGDCGLLCPFGVPANAVSGYGNPCVAGADGDRNSAGRIVGVAYQIGDGFGAAVPAVRL